MSELTSEQRDALRAFCDTVVPAIEAAEDPDGFWARAASDLGVPDVAAAVIATMAPAQAAGIGQLLEALFQAGIGAFDQPAREQLIAGVAASGPEAAAGIGGLIALTLYLNYGLPDATGRNPNWATFGYPGPLSLPPETEKPIRPLVPEGEDTVLEADVCVVGSGAGGGVVAGTLAQRGLKVVVLEAGGYFDESDFSMLEIPAYQQLYWRGGPTPTADLNVSLQAGACLGGGTVVNWTNCLRTHPWVREEWAGEHGLDGVDAAEFDRHLDAVLERLGATDAVSDPNGPTQRLREGADALGWSFRRVVRNADPERYTPETAAFMGFGDQSGSKRSTAKTYLLDAVEHGAEVLVRTRAQRVLVEGGRAAGVEALYEDRVKVTVRAPQVVVACGALESPALLLRSGIGGPAVGRYLRLHPCTAVIGLYESDQQAWWGAPHTGLIDEHADAEAGHGFLIETAQYTTAIGASAIPWTSGREHKEMLERYGHAASFIALLRDHGHGRVTIDADGNAVPSYALADELDVRNARRGLDAMARVHEAAGAQEIAGLCAGLPRWTRGDDLDAFVATLQGVPLAAGGHRLFSAHQMGSCRMGADPATSVANPEGELHDTPGVWIGDGSAFPSASGTNPMITIMALASRTSDAMAARASAGAASAR